MRSPVSVYRIFRRSEGDHGAAPVRAVVIAMVIAAAALTATGVYRVSAQHEVLRYGYQLSVRTEHVRALQETRRRLELERSVLSAPERMRKLATQLGMAQVAPDKIRVVTRGKVATR